MQTFDQLVTKVEEGWWGQQKAKIAGLGSSITGDKAGAAKKQAQSLAMGSNAFALFDQFKQDMLELTKSTDQLQFNKSFPEQAKFITNIEANLAVLKAGNVGDPAAPEQQPDVATTKGAASAAARADRAQTAQQNQDQARAATNPTDAAATAGGVAPTVTASIHVNDVDMINEAYYGMQEAPLGKAKWAARRAKMGNLFKTVTGKGSEVVDATMAAVNSRMGTFKKKFQQSLGKLQTDLTAVGLGAESPALQAITNTLGSAEQITPPKPEELAAAAPKEPGPEEPADDTGSTINVGGDGEPVASFGGQDASAEEPTSGTSAAEWPPARGPGAAATKAATDTPVNKKEPSQHPEALRSRKRRAAAAAQKKKDDRDFAKRIGVK